MILPVPAKQICALDIKDRRMFLQYFPTWFFIAAISVGRMNVASTDTKSLRLWDELAWTWCFHLWIVRIFGWCSELGTALLSIGAWTRAFSRVEKFPTPMAMTSVLIRLVLPSDKLESSPTRNMSGTYVGAFVHHPVSILSTSCRYFFNYSANQ